jgi:hypothetical protein
VSGLTAEERDKLFKDHKATYAKYRGPNGEDIEYLKWAAPTGSFHWMQFVRVGWFLAVAGDCYEATYAWHGANLTLDWIADTHLGYFASKCRASPKGVPFVSWSTERLIDRLVEYFSDHYEGDLEHNLERVKELEEFDELGGWTAAEASQLEWDAWVLENGYDVWGSDYYEYAPSGKELDVCCELHHEGLRRAMAWLKENKEGPYAEEAGVPVVLEVSQSGNADDAAPDLG